MRNAGDNEKAASLEQLAANARSRRHWWRRTSRSDFEVGILICLGLVDGGGDMN